MNFTTDFSTEERNFLRKKHGRMVSIEGMEVPPVYLQRILEIRSKTLGNVFTQFRDAHTPQPDGAVIPLELELVENKLW
jgi:hypothetical protein